MSLQRVATGQALDHNDQGTGATSLWIETVDTQPHLGDGEYAGGGKYGKIEYNADANGHACVRGRPMPCFTTQCDPAAEAGMYWIRKIGLTTASVDSFAVAQEWLKQCLSHGSTTTWQFHHILKRGVNVPPVYRDHAWTASDLQCDVPVERLSMEQPTRLVDLCPEAAAPGSVRLVELPQSPLEYATLSYCWGILKGRSWLTCRRDLQAQRESIVIDSLPLTVRNGFTIASRLGIRYIWVDALCILQDDLADWAKESAKMAGIFRRSLVTIAASFAASVDQGCFNLQSSSHLHRFDGLIAVRATLSDGRQSNIYMYKKARPDMYIEDVQGGALADRAWVRNRYVPGLKRHSLTLLCICSQTYQEQVLSHRTIYYTSSQLIWNCEHCRLAEDNFPTEGDALYPILGLDHALTGAALLDLWYMGAVIEFARRKITYGSDKLVAISALAKATYLNNHVEYIAGLWKDSIMTGLLWQRRGKGGKTKSYRCPSWSWASQDSAISYELATARRHGSFSSTGSSEQDLMDRLSAKVIEVNIESDVENVYGSVSAGYINVATSMITGWVLMDNFGKWSYEREQAIVVTTTHSILRGNAYMDDDDRAIQQVAGAFLAEYHEDAIFMLLHPPVLDAKVYTRKGIARFEYDAVEQLLGTVTQATITII